MGSLKKKDGMVSFKKARNGTFKKSLKILDSMHAKG
jgi:hypothetical protein